MLTVSTHHNILAAKPLFGQSDKSQTPPPVTLVDVIPQMSKLPASDITSKALVPRYADEVTDVANSRRIDAFTPDGQDAKTFESDIRTGKRTLYVPAWAFLSKEPYIGIKGPLAADLFRDFYRNFDRKGYFAAFQNIDVRKHLQDIKNELQNKMKWRRAFLPPMTRTPKEQPAVFA